MFLSQQRKIEAQLNEYRNTVALCMSKFQETFQRYCRDSDPARLQSDYSELHHYESLADDIRREIEVVMYSNALFPESRGDILGLLETMDKIPNQAEATVQVMLTHHISIPEAFRPQTLQLVEVCRRCVDALLDSAAKLFQNFTNAAVAIGKIDELESEADSIEADLTSKIFSSDLAGFDKLLLRDIVKDIAAVSDRAENAGDRIRIIVAKRRA